MKFPLHQFNLRAAHYRNRVKIAAEAITLEPYTQNISWNKLQMCMHRVREAGQEPRVVEDGASVHIKGAAAQVRELVDIPHKEHIASSPGLNCIGTAWRHIQAELKRLKYFPSSLNELWEAVETIWDVIPQVNIDGWIDSMEIRRLAVFAAGGKQTRY